MSFTMRLTQFLRDVLFTRSFFLFASSSFLVAWRLRLLHLDGKALGFGPAWLQNTVGIIFPMLASYLLVSLVGLLAAWVLMAAFPEIRLEDEQRPAGSMGLLFALVHYSFVLAAFWAVAFCRADS